MHADRTGRVRGARRRRAPARFLAGALLAATAALATQPPANAGAEIARQSPAVVRQATEALGRYRWYVDKGTPVSLRRYNRARNQAARATAVAVELAPRPMVRAWRAADRRHQVAVLAALTQLGTAYRSYGSTPRTGFDCSGLTSWAWRQAGVRIPRSSGDQIEAAAPRRRLTAHAGDIVHYPGHVSLYLGVALAIVHASDPQDDVELAFVSRRVRWGDPTG
jgi:cell wall-associated NlpC family hydrolase